MLQAAAGRPGCELFASSPTALVLTDIIMPAQAGMETIPRLHRLHHPLAIIAMSGGPTNSPQHLEFARGLGARRVIPKPFTPEELTRLVAEVLAEPPPPSRYRNGSP